MMEIFKRSDAAMLSEWISRFETDENVKLSAERKIALLELTEQKAGTENNAAITECCSKAACGFV